ncbi:hypothetical protein G6F42_024214 [Rhizopus arrhizus]|nr:hypothetical protein G6F42_024214 [Rhizopus arrhizus]
MMHPAVPSPKLSKSSNIYQKSPPLFVERQRKGSLVPLPSMMSPGNPHQQQNVKLGSMTPSFERPNMGIRF